MTIDNHENHDNRPHEHRMVVLLGPHKSASSSVQELFMEHASGGPQGDRLHHPSLVHWTWPYHVRRRSYLPRKGFAPLVTEGIGFHELIWDSMGKVWNGSTAATATLDTTAGADLPPQSQQQHMIWGTEELDRFGTTPWSHRNGIHAIQQVVERMPPTHLDLVVNYRRPRQDQWLSIWKQLYRKTETTNNNKDKSDDDASSYATFLCDPDEQVRIWEYLDCVANPLGLVTALLEAFSADSSLSSSSSSPRTRTTVHLLDMQGIAALHRDVGHIVACDVLQVPCTHEHWLPHIDRPIVQNSRSRPSGLTMDQLDDMEWMLRYRDCSYRRQLLPPPLPLEQPTAGTLPNASASVFLSLHYAETLWEGCDEMDNNDDDDDDDDEASMYRYGRNTTWLLERLQSQVGCGPLPTTAIGEWRRRTVPSRTNGKQEQRPVAARFAPPLDNEYAWQQTTMATRIGCTLYLLLLATFGISLVRRLKCGRGCFFTAKTTSMFRHKVAMPPSPRSCSMAAP